MVSGPIWVVQGIWIQGQWVPLAQRIVQFKICRRHTHTHFGAPATNPGLVILPASNPWLVLVRRQRSAIADLVTIMTANVRLGEQYPLSWDQVPLSSPSAMENNTVIVQPAYIRMLPLQPCPQAKGNCSTLRPHYSTFLVHYPAFGLPRSVVYGIFMWNNVAFGNYNFHCPIGQVVITSHFFSQCAIIVMILTACQHIGVFFHFHIQFC